ncbi:nitrogenase iron-molybdenum cofactor biosynthesis protein NifN [Ideonella sp. 4Y16]|uniref:Nitrogenase iron-molybdenum cofactor biosynthesis protein NifN n=1 Tax=Ideonella alba TaxID=2824118 RepID=A0A941BHV0_9BURK|nr:nitrogenase iron-molybdenum cofactor biosynthesis protein NifN [Ideonella alba]MBQ0933542.1 nitrogenase iron-molybdenum cofactor biosynthesis protein NifN [Ideonella alba]MBQ0946480.1 nitrogenase iron-molybdenum cofactor biosynthesis protein NifN [Ideonella alba]
MAHVSDSKKACAVNPLKMSAPLGASYAFLGLQSCMPVMHGSQGCTSFGLVLLVRHFKEAIPLQTTAMNEVTTIMGGYENIEKALLNIRSRAKPALIAICSTGLTETKGDDVPAFITLARQKHPELADTAIVYVSTPDYVGAFQDGWAIAVKGLVEQLAEPVATKVAQRVALLPGCHLTPADLEELREIVESFGLEVLIAPDVSGSLDGHIPEDWLGTTLGGTPLDELRALGSASACIAVGEQMRPAAEALQQRCGVPYRLFNRLTGLAACDELLMHLSALSGQPVPARWRRQRSQLVDAMLDGHFHFGHQRVAIAAEPDLLWALGHFITEMGAELSVAVTTTQSPLLAQLPCNEVVIGDLEDFELAAKVADADLLISHSHGRQAAERLGKPLYRAGLPLFDRIGNAHVLSVGYRGTRNLVYALGNQFIDQIPHHGPNDWPLGPAARAAARGDASPATAPAIAAASF